MPTDQQLIAVTPCTMTMVGKIKSGEIMLILLTNEWRWRIHAQNAELATGQHRTGNVEGLITLPLDINNPEANVFFECSLPASGIQKLLRHRRITHEWQLESLQPSIATQYPAAKRLSTALSNRSAKLAKDAKLAKRHGRHHGSSTR